MAAWAGSTNLGDELVLAALLAKLAARGISPLVVSVDPAGTTTAHGVAATGLLGVAVRREQGGDGVLLGGGGLLQDETSPFNLPFHLGRALLAAGLHRPLAGIGLGAGPLGRRGSRRLVGAVLTRSVAVSVRDAASQRLLADVGVGATLAADLAVSLPRPQVHVDDRLAVSLRPWTGGGGALPIAIGRRRPVSDNPAWFAPAMAAALDTAAAATGLGVHFVALQGDRDDAVHRQVAARMRQPATFAVPDVHTVVAEVAACQAVVAMRYHAGIAALLGGRPAVLVGYSPKVGSLASEVAGGMVDLSWESRSLPELPTALDHVLDKGEAVVEGCERLRMRERANDEVIDRLVDAVGAG